MKRHTNERKHTRSPLAILKTSNPRFAVGKLKLRSAFVCILAGGKYLELFRAVLRQPGEVLSFSDGKYRQIVSRRSRFDQIDGTKRRKTLERENWKQLFVHQTRHRMPRHRTAVRSRWSLCWINVEAQTMQITSWKTIKISIRNRSTESDFEKPLSHRSSLETVRVDVKSSFHIFPPDS